MASNFKSTTVNGDLTLNGSNSVFLNSMNSQNAIRLISNDSTNYFQAKSNGNDAGYITFCGYNASRGSTALINFTTLQTLNLQPAANNLYDIGTQSLKWNRLYCNIISATTLNITEDIYARAFYGTSDRRLKENIETLENRGWLKPCSFTMKADGSKHLGFIAQEVQELYPELVTERADGMLILNYPELTAVLASQLNTIRDEYKELKEKYSELKQELQDIKTMIKA